MATLYFFNTVAADDTDWYTLENWWTDVGLTTQASSLPSSTDDVFLLSIPSNSGNQPTVNSLTVDASLVFLTFPITVTTIATFNYTSENRSTVTGDAIFNTSSVNYGGTVIGNATFNNNSYADAASTIDGDVTLNDNGLILGATVTGNATFNNSEITNVGATAYATIDGTITFNNPIVFTFSGENYNWNGSSNAWIFNDTHEWVFNSGASNLGYVNGNATFYNNSANFNLQNRNATVDGDAVFNDSSFNGDIVTGNATFNDSAKNNSGAGHAGTVQGDATFSQSSFSDTDWHSSISGVLTFTSETPVAFTVSNDIDWNLDTTGWVFDTSGQNWIFNNTAHNTSIINGDVTFNNESYNSNWDGTTYNALINGNVIFNADSYNIGKIVGSATFYGYSSNGVLSGNNTPSYGVDGQAVFYEYTWNFNNVGDGSIFNDNSYNSGQVNGDAIFNDDSSNGLYDNQLAGGIINGDAYFNDTSYNYFGAVLLGIAYFQPSAAETTLRYNCGGTEPNLLINNPEIVYEKGINGSSILGIV